jgi:hypothetical protein
MLTISTKQYAELVRSLDAADSNLDLIAGSGAKQKLNFRVDGPSLTMI